jgi:citrate synthase
MLMKKAKLSLNGAEYEFPVLVGTENEVGIDFTKLRSTTGAITLDPGYANTGACTSTITFIDGERGILRYRGYPIEEVAEAARFEEVCYLLIYGRLPTRTELDEFTDLMTHHTLIHEDLKNFFQDFPPSAHPMMILSAMVACLSAFYSTEGDDDDLNIVRLLAKVKTLAAFSYKKSIGQPFVYPRNDLSYTETFLHTMFSVPAEPYVVPPVLDKALNLLLILHADHEQNCSTSSVRMVGSSLSNIFSAVSAGISALWGPLHGGANQRVIEMLKMIDREGGNYKKFVDKAKDKNDPFKLMGFGHRVYKNFDPRARILKGSADEVLSEMGVDDPLLEIAKNLEEVALEDSFFIERKLYPNVDFYSGILYRAMGIPTEMFTVMFALGRLPGWIAQWKEMREDPKARIARPRQIYLGEAQRPFVPLELRGETTTETKEKREPELAPA